MSRTTLILLAGVLVTSGCVDAGEETPAMPSSPMVFSDVTQAAGLAGFRHVNGAAGESWFPETMGAGAAVLDINGDGWQDLVLVAGGGWTESSETALQVWMNEGDGTFVREPAAEPRGLAPYGFGVAAGDIDRDGDLDLVYTSLTRDAILRNDGGRFVDVSQTAGLSPSSAWSTAATLFDADGDGWLDLYIGQYVDWTPETDIYCSQDGQTKGYCTPELYPGVAGQFYLNRGDGTFEDRTEAAGFGEALGKTLGALVLDHNRDGLPDLMLANDTEPDELFLNRGEGRFEEVGVVSGVAFDERGRARAGMGINAGIVDDTGEETLFVGNFSSEMIGVYRHLGNDVFLDRAASSRIGRPSLLTLTFGITLADFDLDGDLDVFTANGHVQPQIERVKENIRFRQAPHLFRNEGDATFTDVWETSSVEADSGWLARASVWFDADNDGDADLLVTENGGPVHLLRNDTGGRNGLTVRLDGMSIGARVRLYSNGAAQERYIRAGESYLGQSQLDPIFGIRGSAEADSVVVEWASGEVSRVVAPGPVREITVAEPRR